MISWFKFNNAYFYFSIVVLIVYMFILRYWISTAECPLVFHGWSFIGYARDISVTLICNIIFDNIILIDLLYWILYLKIDLGSTVLNWKFIFSMVTVNNSLFSWSLCVILDFRVVRGLCYSITWNFSFKFLFNGIE